MKREVEKWDDIIPSPHGSGLRPGHKEDIREPLSWRLFLRFTGALKLPPQLRKGSDWVQQNRVWAKDGFQWKEWTSQTCAQWWLIDNQVPREVLSRQVKRAQPSSSHGGLSGREEGKRAGLRVTRTVIDLWPRVPRVKIPTVCSMQGVEVSGETKRWLLQKLLRLFGSSFRFCSFWCPLTRTQDFPLGAVSGPLLAAPLVYISVSPSK